MREGDAMAATGDPTPGGEAATPGSEAATAGSGAALAGGEHMSSCAGPPWWEEPLNRFANVDDTIRGFTELRCHGVSGPLPGSVLQFPEEMVAQVAGNADSGFWRRWRAGGPYKDVPGERHIEAFCWGGLTSRASLQALWLLVLPFSLVNLANWMLPPYVGGGSKWVARLAVILLRVLALSFTLTLLLAGAEITMDLGAWQCGAVPRCRGKLAPFSLIAKEGNRTGLRLVTGAAVLALVLVLLWRAGLARFRPLIDGKQAPSLAVRRFKPGPGRIPRLSEPSFWAADKSARWLRCLHAVAWCAGLGAILAGALHGTAKPGTTAARVGGGMLTADLIAVAVVFLLVLLPDRFGRGGAGFTGTRGIRWVSALGVALLAANIGVTIGYLPNSADPGHSRLPWLQGAFGRLALGQVAVLILLAVCVIWLAIQAREHDRERAAGYRPMLGGLLAVVISYLGWLLGLSFSAGLGLWVAGRLGQAVSSQRPAPGGPLQLLVPPVYAWIDAATVAAAVVVLAGAIIILVRMFLLTGRIARKIEAKDPNCPPENARTWSGSPTRREKQAKARSAARVRILARSVESVPWILAVACLVTAGITGAAIWRYLLLPARTNSWFPQAGWIASVPTAGAWIATTGAAATVALAYAAYRNANTRRLVGILWDVTTFWPRANHPLTPACSAERAVPQLADRIVGLTGQGGDALVLSAHSQGTILGAAAMLRLAHGDDAGRLAQVALLTYGCPLRRLYARAFPAYFSWDVLEQVREDVGRRWLNLWAYTDPIGGTVVPAGYARPGDGPPGAGAGERIGRLDWQMCPDPLTLGVDPRTGEPVAVCDHSGYLSRPEYPVAVGQLHELIGTGREASRQVPPPRTGEASEAEASGTEASGTDAAGAAAQDGGTGVTAPPETG